jgi:hypothetical protein
MEICLWLLARADLHQTPMIRNRRASLNKMARSLAKNWAMQVCSRSIALFCRGDLTIAAAIFGAGATVGSNIVNSIF